MSKKWFKQELGNNVIQFTRGDDALYAPEIIGKRYVIEDVLSASGGFGIIYVAQDTRLLGRKVLIKARRYDKEEGLFSYKNKMSRKEKIETIRKRRYRRTGRYNLCPTHFLRQTVDLHAASGSGNRTWR